MSNFQSYTILTGDAFFTGIGSRPYGISANGSSGTTKVGGSRLGYIIDDGNYTVRVPFTLYADVFGGSWSANFDLFVGGALADSRSASGGPSTSIEDLTIPFFIPNGSTGELQVVASLTQPGLFFGTVSVLWAGGNFTGGAVPPSNNCDCCCCLED